MSKTFTTMGATNHSKTKRAKHDFYETPEMATQALMKVEKFNHLIWEPACGKGAISKVLKTQYHHVQSSDLNDYGFGAPGLDFLTTYSLYNDLTSYYNGDIVTNPPFNKADEFIEKALGIVKPGAKVALFLRLLSIEGQKRGLIYKQNPPKTIYAFSKRLSCKKDGNAIAFAWFVWVKGYKGTTKLKWI